MRTSYIDLNNEGKAKGEKYEVVYLKNGFVSFTGREMEHFVEEWLKDVAVSYTHLTLPTKA